MPPSHIQASNPFFEQRSEICQRGAVLAFGSYLGIYSVEKAGVVR